LPFRAGAHDAGINTFGNTDGADRTDEKTDRSLLGDGASRVESDISLVGKRSN
jgi:hypothetical protein